MNILIIIIVVIMAFAVIRAFALSPEQREQVKKQVEDDIAFQMQKNEKTTVEVHPKEEPQYDYYSFNVVGMKYCSDSTKRFIDQMIGGETVELVKDPKNRYDKNAIKVVAYNDFEMEDVRIGYVPSDEVLEVRKIIEDNPCYECTLDEVYCDLDDDYFSISAEIKY